MKPLIYSIFFLSSLLSTVAMAQQDNNATPSGAKPQANIRVADPFARGVNKPIAYGEIPKPNNKESAVSSVQTSGDNIRALQDISAYRLVGVTSKAMHQKPNIVGPSLNMPNKGQAAMKYYIRLGSYNKPNYAKQYGWDFFSANKSLLDANFVLRQTGSKKKPMFTLDYGPFNDYLHAVVACQELTRHITPPVKNCPLVREFMSSEEQNSYTSTAQVGLSASAISQLSDSDIYDPKKLVSTSFKVREGETLGAEQYTVVKINQDGIYLAKLGSTMYFMPIDIIPFNLPGAKEDKSSNKAVTTPSAPTR